MKIAALDLGTNSFLCLIIELSNSGELKVLCDESVVVRLGQDLKKTGRIQPEALTRAEECLSQFSQLIKKHQVHKVEAVATATAREAENAEEFLNICRKYNIPIRTITGQQEARMSFRGAISKDEKSRCLLIDIGGGSTEYVVGVPGQVDFSVSLPYGAVKLTEEYISQQPIDTQDELNIKRYIRSRSEETWAQIESHKPEKVLAVAGTPTSLVAAILGEFNASKIEGYKLDITTLTKWVDNFKKTSVEEKRLKYNLGARADVIFAGSCILLEVLLRLQLPELFVSTKGIRYGLAYQMVDDLLASNS